MPDQWFMRSSGIEKGPFTAAELKGLIERGELLDSDELKSSSEDLWIEVGQMRGLELARLTATAAENPAVPASSESDAQAAANASSGVAEMPAIETGPISVAARYAKPPEKMTGDVKPLSPQFGPALSALATNPVGGLSTAYKNLGAIWASAVGILLGIAFTAGWVLGLVPLLFGLLLGGRQDFPPGAGVPTMSMKEFGRSLLPGVVPYFCVALAIAIAGLAFRGRHALGSCLFLAGMAVFPCGLAIFLLGMSGAENPYLIAAVMLFAVTTFIVVLWSGCTTVQRIHETAATFAVPLIVLIASYSLYYILSKMMGF